MKQKPRTSDIYTAKHRRKKIAYWLISHDIIVLEALTICQQLFDMVELSHLKTFK